MIPSAKPIARLKLPYQAPYDWESLLAFFESHQIHGSEWVHNGIYQRVVINPDGTPTLLSLANRPEQNHLELTLHGTPPADLAALTARLRGMFDLDGDPAAIGKSFARSTLLKKIHKKYPGMRLPRGWDPFEILISTILGQLVSVKQAQNLARQLIEGYGTRVTTHLDRDVWLFPTAATLATADLAAVRTTGRRRETIRAVASLVASGDLMLDGQPDLALVRATLAKIKGIGPWTLEYGSMRALGDRDALPAKDLIIARVLQAYPDIKPEHFRPWRSYLAIYLWKEFAAQMTKKGGKADAL